MVDKQEQKKTTSMRLDTRQIEGVELYSTLTGLGASEIYRRAIDEFLQNHVKEALDVQEDILRQRQAAADRLVELFPPSDQL